MEKIINNTKVNYSQKGNGDYIFILHGWGCYNGIYSDIANVLSASYTVVIPDMPGFGKSDEPDFGWDTDDYTDFVIEFIKSFGVKSVSLIGHSFGVRLMITMATREIIPFEINKMVFIDGAGILSKKVDHYLKLFDGFVLEKSKIENKNDIVEIKKIQEKYLSYDSVSGDFIYLSDVMCDCYRNAVITSLESKLSQINVSTLLIWGDNDDLTPLEDGKTMEKLIPDSGLVILNGAGHFSFLDQPYLFSRVLKSFFNIESNCQ